MEPRGTFEGVVTNTAREQKKSPYTTSAERQVLFETARRGGMTWERYDNLVGVTDEHEDSLELLQFDEEAITVLDQAETAFTEQMGAVLEFVDGREKLMRALQEVEGSGRHDVYQLQQVREQIQSILDSRAEKIITENREKPEQRASGTEIALDRTRQALHQQEYQTGAWMHQLYAGAQDLYYEQLDQMFGESVSPETKFMFKAEGGYHSDAESVGRAVAICKLQAESIMLKRLTGQPAPMRVESYQHKVTSEQLSISELGKGFASEILARSAERLTNSVTDKSGPVSRDRELDQIGYIERELDAVSCGLVEGYAQGATIFRSPREIVEQIDLADQAHGRRTDRFYQGIRVSYEAHPGYVESYCAGYILSNLESGKIVNQPEKLYSLLVAYRNIKSEEVKKTVVRAMWRYSQMVHTGDEQYAVPLILKLTDEPYPPLDDESVLEKYEGALVMYEVGVHSQIVEDRLYNKEKYRPVRYNNIENVNPLEGLRDVRSLEHGVSKKFEIMFDVASAHASHVAIGELADALPDLGWESFESLFDKLAKKGRAFDFNVVQNLAKGYNDELLKDLNDQERRAFGALASVMLFTSGSTYNGGMWLINDLYEKGLIDAQTVTAAHNSAIIAVEAANMALERKFPKGPRSRLQLVNHFDYLINLTDTAQKNGARIGPFSSLTPFGIGYVIHKGRGKTDSYDFGANTSIRTYQVDGLQVPTQTELTAKIGRHADQLTDRIAQLDRMVNYKLLTNPGFVEKAYDRVRDLQPHIDGLDDRAWTKLGNAYGWHDILGNRIPVLEETCRGLHFRPGALNKAEYELAESIRESAALYDQLMEFANNRVPGWFDISGYARDYRTKKEQLEHKLSQYLSRTAKAGSPQRDFRSEAKAVVDGLSDHDTVMKLENEMKSWLATKISSVNRAAEKVCDDVLRHFSVIDQHMGNRVQPDGTVRVVSVELPSQGRDPDVKWSYSGNLIDLGANYDTADRPTILPLYHEIARLDKLFREKIREAFKTRNDWKQDDVRRVPKNIPPFIEQLLREDPVKIESLFGTDFIPPSSTRLTTHLTGVLSGMREHVSVDQYDGYILEKLSDKLPRDYVAACARAIQ